MKKLLLIFAMLLTVSIASAKGPKFLGSWMSEKVVVKGADRQMFMPLTFEDDHDIIAEDDVFGVWHYDKKTNSINIKSFMIRQFNGDWEIKELSKNVMLLKMGDFEWHLFKYDKEAIAETNASLGLNGLWKIESNVSSDASNEGESSEAYINFKDMDFNVKEISEGYSSKSSGSWMYKPKEKSILFMAGRRASLSDEAKIISFKDGVLVLKNNGSTLTLKKVETVDIKPLTFDYDYLEQHMNIEDNPPWGEFERLAAQASDVNLLVYKKGVYNSEIQIFDYSVIAYAPEFDQENGSVNYSILNISGTDTVQEDQLSIGDSYGSENEFFPQERLGNYMVVGKETITVPAGSFECTVVIGYGDDDAKYKYWMIDNKPGVYAKIISQKEDFGDEMEYIEMELQEIK